MKRLLALATIASISTFTLNASDLKASFANPTIWNGKIVPKTAVCSNFNTMPGSTPAISLTNIPMGTKNIILTFTDETFKGMSNGGHGTISYSLTNNTKKVTIPSVKGETFDLPKNFTSVIEHRGTKFGKTAGAYLAPCSGGKGNTYSVLIQTVDNHKKVLDSTKLTLGKF